MLDLKVNQSTVELSTNESNLTLTTDTVVVLGDTNASKLGRITTLLDFSDNIPINDGNIHLLGDYYDSQEQAESVYAGVPIQQAAAILGDWALITVASCAAWLASISNETTIFVPDGRYIMNIPLILRKDRQRWISTPDDRQVFKHHNPRCAFEYIGDASGFRRVLTRRKYRGSSTDPTDAPMVACVQIEAMGVRFSPTVVIEHNTDWAANHPNDLLGGDPVWDCGIFIGCRIETSLQHGGALGHHKFANLYVDVTRSALLSELTGWDGVTHTATLASGVDGLCLDYTSFSGGRWRVAMLGAQFKAGLNSYGSDYTEYLTITFNEQPLVGETITLGEQVFVFGDSAPFSQFAVPLGETKEETALNLMTLTRDIIDLQDSSRPKLNSASFIVDGHVITAVDNSNSTHDFTLFTIATTSSSISFSGTSVSTQPDPAQYYDHILGLVTDGRGGYGASDITAYRMMTTESEYLEGRRVWEDIRGDLDHTLEVISAGAMWLDIASANSYRRAWGQRYISCRFASYDPFIVRLGRIARVTFLDCHTEPAERSIKDLAGNPTRLRYGSYTNTPESLAINIDGGNAAPYGNHFKLRDKGSNISRPLSGTARIGGALAVKRAVTIGGGSTIEDPSTLNLYGGSYQTIKFGDNTKSNKAEVRYTPSDKRLTFFLGGDSVTTPARAFRCQYNTTLGLAVWDTSSKLKITSILDVDVSSDAQVSLTGLTGKVIQYDGTTLKTMFQWDSTATRFNLPIRPDTTNSNVATIGTSGVRWGKAWINDVRLIPQASATPTATGELSFEAISDTQVRLRLRGSDGINRSSILTFT